MSGESQYKQKIMIWKKWASSSFLQLIHHFLGLRQNELTEPKGKDRPNRGICESFQKESSHALASEWGDILVREVLLQSLSISLAWSLTPPMFAPSYDATTNVRLPFLSLFLYLGPDLTWYYLASTTPLMKYVLLIPWFKNFYNLFCFPFNFVFFNPVVLLFPFWICSEGSISLCF